MPRGSTIEERKRAHFDALARQYVRVAARILERAVRGDSDTACRCRVEVLEEPGLVRSHVRGIVPALAGLVGEVVDFAAAVRIPKVDRPQGLRCYRGSIAYCERCIAQRSPDRAPEVNLNVAPGGELARGGAEFVLQAPRGGHFSVVRVRV